MSTADLSGMVSQLEQMAGLAVKAAPAVGDVLRAKVEAGIAEGKDPYGVAWKLVQSGPRKGEKALRGAAAKLQLDVIGYEITLRVRGIEGRHHKGAVKGKVKRPIVPDKRGLPKSWAPEIRAVLDTTFRQIKQAGAT